MRSVADQLPPPKTAPLPKAAAAIKDADAIKAICAALALAIIAIGFRIVAIW
jgi:hypothetical protein